MDNDPSPFVSLGSNLHTIASSRATVESHMMRSIGFHVLFQKHALKTLLMVHFLLMHRYVHA
jgi:hypothetical protein